MALLVYNLLLILFFPAIYLLMLIRRARGKEALAAWAERWGSPPEAIGRDPRTPRFWVHAVSVGEVMAAVPVLRELRKRWPDALIVLSTTTPGGREVAQKQCPPADYVIGYPLDFPFAVNRALAVVRPDAVLLMEWEIWPNFLTAAKKRGAKIAVLNGRISDRGLRRGLKGGFFTHPGLDVVDAFLMQSAEDARRAALVGAAPEKISNVGNTKFDESAAILTTDERAVLRDDLGIAPDAPVWVCGSTRNGEEEVIAEALTEIRKQFSDMTLVVAPRHLNRADEAAAVFEEAGLAVQRRSEQRHALTPRPPLPQTREGEPNTLDGLAERGVLHHRFPLSRLRERGPGGEGMTPTGRVLLLDTFGELARVYAVADVAFIGGSLKPFGGQSVFQPLAQGVPVVFGPYMNNQRDISALAKAEGIGFEVTDAKTLAAQAVRLMTLSPGEKAKMAAKARGLIDRNQGVSARCVDDVVQLLGQKADGAA